MGGCLILFNIVFLTWGGGSIQDMLNQKNLRIFSSAIKVDKHVTEINGIIPGENGSTPRMHPITRSN